MPTHARHYSDESEAIIARHMDRMRGRLAGAFEAMALPEKQELAIIALMKSLSYDTQDAVLDALRRAQAD